MNVSFNAIHGLGQADCGDNPCGAFDWVYVRDACLNYLACADPTDPRYVGATQGLFTAVGATTGTVVGKAAGAAVGAAGAGAASTSGVPAWAWGVSLALIGGVVILGLVKR